MTVTNPDLSRTVSAQLRPLLVSFYAHVILWYSLYGVALLQTAPPVWALDFIEQLKPTLGALETAARLSERPFPAQVMILYAIPSTLLLGMYWASYMFLVKHNRQEFYRGMCERWGQTGPSVKERLGFAAFGVTLLYAFGYALPVHSFVEGGYWFRGYLNGWMNPALFSSSILSTTCLLLMSMGMGFAFVFAPMGLYVSIYRFQSPTSIRS